MNKKGFNRDFLRISQNRYASLRIEFVAVIIGRYKL